MAAQESYMTSQTTTEPQLEAGLAEWATKIKAIQRQVDADEEAEHVRLEQEIAASRLARVRRSQGLGYANRSTSSLVSSLKDEAESFGISDNDSEATYGDTPKPNALQALSGSPPAAIPTRASQLLRETRGQASSQNGMKQQSVSLASFIGGRATGPRLTKPAPKPDAHDPTQFEQRNAIQASHPLFGSGGVAMPGIAVRRDGPAKPSSLTTLNNVNTIPQSSESSAAAQRYGETYQRTLSLPHSPEVRERTKSTPCVAFSAGRETSTLSVKTSISIHSASLTSNKNTEQQAFRTRSTSPADRGVDDIKTPSKSPILLPSLAGPIRPQPRPSPTGPQIPPSGAPSKAFLRTLVQKEPTPSLSRLQGRGFVQNMVNMSTRLESPPPSVPVTPEKNKPASGRRSSVLDRWQTNASLSTPSPPVSPDSRSVRRSVTVDSIMEKQVFPQEPLSQPFKETTSNQSSQENTPSHSSPLFKPNDPGKAAGLGSNTTLVVFKPEPVDALPIDEFGAKPSRVSNLPAVAKPLSHPTKGRARKPRKQQTTSSDKDSNNVEMDLSPPLIEPTMSPPTTQDILRVPSPKPSTEPIPAPSIDITKMTTASDQVGQTLPGFVIINDDANSEPRPMLPSSKKYEAVPIRQALAGLASPGGKRPLPSPTAQGSDGAKNVDHGVARRALPGMTAPAHEASLAEKPNYSSRLYESQVSNKPDKSTLVSLPSAKPRIPSTGSRPTVMDVAQTLVEREGSNNIGDLATRTTDFSQSLTVVQTGSWESSSLKEKRRSSYEKYTSVILPPLKEEATPTPTPTSTLSRKSGNTESLTLRGMGDAVQSISHNPLLPEAVNTRVSRRVSQEIDIDSLLNYSIRPFGLNSGVTISIEVLVIIGTTAALLSKDTTVFYDTEILAIIHRFKSRKSGLASIWGWEGQRAKLGEREQHKLEELAKRYGTAVDIVHQHSEPPYLVHTLGGVLAIRQGTRRHWTPENTAMHLVRSLSGVVVIDEKDLNIKNLCSAYSYCVSILDSVYVWYGCGSTPLERAAALEYGRSLTTTSPPIEITEGTDDDDEIFWMILGEDNYADAYYWRWRRTSPITDPKAWQVRVDLGKGSVTQVESFSKESYGHDSVYIIDSIWELYVIVAVDARARRQDIDLALRLALEISDRVSLARPHTPTVHVLVLPSQLPKDLKLMFREFDEFSVNKGEIPDHMNILSSAEARKHLDTLTWNGLALRDPTILPLGIGTQLLDFQQ